MREKPKIMPGSTQPSVPPDSSTSALARRAAASPRSRCASVELVQPVDSTWLTPRRPSAIEISLDTMPQMPTAMAYGVTCWPPFGEEILVLLLADVDAAAAAADDHAGVRLADAQAGVVPGLARRDHAEQRGARIALRIGASSVAASLASRQWRARRCRREAPAPRPGRDRSRASNSVIARVPLRPAADRVPEHLATDAERRHDADAGDRDARWL